MAVAQLLEYQQQVEIGASLFLVLPKKETASLLPSMRKLLSDNSIGVFPI
jgi:hypothetical protein